MWVVIAVQHIQDYTARYSRSRRVVQHVLVRPLVHRVRVPRYIASPIRFSRGRETYSVCVHAPTRGGNHRALMQRRFLVNRFRRNRRTWKRSCMREQEIKREKARLNKKNLSHWIPTDSYNDRCCRNRWCYRCSIIRDGPTATSTRKRNLLKSNVCWVWTRRKMFGWINSNSGGKWIEFWLNLLEF